MSQQNDDFISFEKALRDLQMQSEQLKRLVSEGEIRAFRDGDSMKFKREDLEALRRSGGSAAEEAEEELVFAESLEDDTGMVTEELSDEDTLLAEDDLDEDVTAPAIGTRSSSTGSSRVVRSAGAGSRVRAQMDEEQEATPGWVVAAVILTMVIGLYAILTVYTTATGGEADPFGLFVKAAK
ncbi:MAG: hypothetical protein IPM29_12505 [Planctomycetes bacterium]|nr:hypothetical protein [Planctomycetota bacterium]